MKKTRQLILVGTPTTLVSAAGLEKGIEAYNDGDYVTAEAEFRSLAQKGNAVAMNNLGVMYEKGRRVGQCDLQAARHYLLAAELGLADAQNNLGRMHCNGGNANQDDQLAYMGFALAAAQGMKEAEQNREVLAQHMTQEDITKAKEMSRQCLEHGYEIFYAK